MMTREKIKILAAVSFALAVLVTYCSWSYVQEKNYLIAQIDKQLYAAAAAVPFVLDDDFHDRTLDAKSISSNEDLRNIENLSKLNDRLGTKFLYTVIRSQGEYFLSSSSALQEEREQHKEVRYYTPYPDVSITLKQSFDEANVNFSHRNGTYHVLHVPVFSDRWGTYRSIFIPIRTLAGNTYVIGADIDISSVKALLRQNSFKTMLGFFIFTLAIFPIIYAYAFVIKQKNSEYQKVHRLYLDHSKRSVTDPLTQCYNRFKLDNELKTAFDLYQKQGQSFSLLMTDIDYFKKVNDQYGHQVGDTVLQSIAELLKSSSRQTDIVGRWGGEEFMIICQDADINGAYHLAENLRLLIEHFGIKHGCKITASFGVAKPQPDQTLTQLLRQVDEALYMAKRLGRNRTIKAGGAEEIREFPKLKSQS